MHTVSARLGEPPVVVNAGVGVHGTSGPEDVFRVPELWQLHLYDYEAELEVGGTVHPISPRGVSLVPPDTEVRYRYRGRSEHRYVHLRLASTGATESIPLMQDAGTAVPSLAEMFDNAITGAAETPAGASAEVWAALWRIARLPSRTSADPHHPAVAAALTHIEQHLPMPITVPQVAAAVGLSHNHLTRLFRETTGTTIVAHIRRRRLERAAHLLRESTLAIPAVAAAVGIPDLQAFNKACRRELGAAPRAVRAGAPKPGTSRSVGP
jgi:AraC family transcriptional regulator